MTIVTIKGHRLTQGEGVNSRVHYPPTTLNSTIRTKLMLQWSLFHYCSLWTNSDTADNSLYDLSSITPVFSCAVFVHVHVYSHSKQTFSQSLNAHKYMQVHLRPIYVNWAQEY